MTNQQHPITPPFKLVEQWFDDSPMDRGLTLAIQAARWGADQELEACCEVLARELICDGKHVATDLRTVRRPKPPSLKEQAIETVQRLSKDGYPCNYQDDADWDTIRRALEALDD